MEAISVLLVDDHPIVRQGITSLLSLSPDIHIVAEADRASTALEMARLEPDIILLDIRLENQSGLDVARQLRRLHCTSRIIILTSYDDDDYLLEAARIGVEGYLIKDASASILAETIRSVHAGERRLAPSLGGKALHQLKQLSQAQARAQAGMSDEEVRLLEFIADGGSIAQIITALNWSERTIKRKIKSVLSKLGATTRAQAVAEGFRRGLL